MSSFDYHRPRTLEEVWRLRAEQPGARYVGGGTDVMVQLRSGSLNPEALISLRRIEALGAVRK